MSEGIDHAEGERLKEMQQQYDDTVELFQERISQLELALEDFNWYRIIGESQYEFSRQGLRLISQMARIMFLKNPLISRGVRVTAYYVFGQGLTITSPDDEIKPVLQAFLDDSKNRQELTRQEAMTGKEHELETMGNLFFVFFTNKSSGRVLVRTVPLEEIEYIVSNPEDRKEPWLYKRNWVRVDVDEKGFETSETMTAYYPDWQYMPKSKPVKFGGYPVMWDTPIYHKKVGGLPDMKFGLCEFYAAQDWAKAYTDFLQAWSQITQALARFAWKRKAKDARGIAADKVKMQSTISTTSIESNPPPVAGSMAFVADGTDLEPIKTSGATTRMEDGRRLLLMAATVFGLPETFYGDVSVGTLATANTLDRPTELKFRDRQSLWTDTFRDILSYVILQAVKAPNGALAGQAVVKVADDGTERVILADGEEAEIHIDWPPILEHATKDSIAAIVQATTLNSPGIPAGTIDPETVTRLLCQALGVKNVDAVLTALRDNLDQSNAMISSQESQGLAGVVKELNSAIRTLSESYATKEQV